MGKIEVFIIDIKNTTIGPLLLMAIFKPKEFATPWVLLCFIMMRKKESKFYF